MMDYWIPTILALPEAINNYIVTIKLTSKTDPDFEAEYVAIGHYNGKGKWTEDKGKERKVIAWMPLPDVYLERR